MLKRRPSKTCCVNVKHVDMLYVSGNFKVQSEQTIQCEVNGQDYTVQSRLDWVFLCVSCMEYLDKVVHNAIFFET